MTKTNQAEMEQDCMRCEETFVSSVASDHCPKCSANMNRLDMQTPKTRWNSGQLCRVSMSVVKSHCNLPPYIRLVRHVIKNADNGFVCFQTANENTGMAMIRSWKGDFLGDVQVPLASLIF